jgi:hypothetical protein
MLQDSPRSVVLRYRSRSVSILISNPQKAPGEDGLCTNLILIPITDLALLTL